MVLRGLTEKGGYERDGFVIVAMTLSSALLSERELCRQVGHKVDSFM